ncbi:MAG: hypothetical protein KKH12_15875 [Gammaproteobacteria bacterium]|nr:hypothetical protein [Gammaproteobacteria bacterium]
MKPETRARIEAARPKPRPRTPKSASSERRPPKTKIPVTLYTLQIEEDLQRRMVEASRILDFSLGGRPSLTAVVLRAIVHEADALGLQVPDRDHVGVRARMAWTTRRPYGKPGSSGVKLHIRYPVAWTPLLDELVARSFTTVKHLHPALSQQRAPVLRLAINRYCDKVIEEHKASRSARSA